MTKQRYCTILTDEFEPNWLRPIVSRLNAHHTIGKPYGGLWTSPYDKATYDPFVSQWHDFLQTNLSPQTPLYCSSFELTDEANVLALETLSDFMAFLTQYAAHEFKPFRCLTRDELIKERPYLASVPPELMERWQEDLSLQQFGLQQIAIQWEAIFETYDALYVPCGFSGQCCFWGWDVDTLLIGNATCIDLKTLKVEPLPHIRAPKEKTCHA